MLIKKLTITIKIIIKIKIFCLLDIIKNIKVFQKV